MSDEQLSRLPRAVSHGGWPTYEMMQGLTMRSPSVSCPHCSVTGTTSPMVVEAVTVTGGSASLIWHMRCEAGHCHHYPATAPDEDES